MAELDTLNLNDLYQESVELAREQGVADQTTWNELCDEVLESHADMGEMSDDQNVETFRTQLHAMWSQYNTEAGEETLAAASEDPEAPRG